MPVTYIPLATQTLSSAAASVTFSSIPATYTDLIVVINARMSGGGGASSIQAQFNSDTASNYSFTLITGDGSSATSSRASSQTQAAVGLATDTAGEFSPSIIQVMNYSNTTTYKTVLARSGIASDRVRAFVSLWRSTSAINRIDLINNGATTFVAGSTFSLYGVASTAVGAKATGGNIFNDGTYFYHAFTASGTFTPSSTLSCDVLVVAGGGSGGYSRPGGGGAGGLLGFTGQSISTAQTITVGAGGAFPPVSGVSGNSGSNSQFGSLTAAAGGGGGGGGAGVVAGVAGGSSGGSGESSASIVAPSPSGQGSAGGRYNGGGGGATQAGADGYGLGSTTTGKGGDGSSAYSSWGAATGTGENVSGTYWFAGGGAGYAYPLGAASGGNGGGGDNIYPSSPNTAGAANTGGGGSADYQGAGGSGLVIVRYPV